MLARVLSAWTHALELDQAEIFVIYGYCLNIRMGKMLPAIVIIIESTDSSKELPSLRTIIR
jgi:hypothetical protein